MAKNGPHNGGPPKGNNNAGKGKSWRDALDKELKQYTNKDAKVDRGQALRRIARTVVEQALVGNKDAWQEIGNRLDGRAAQSVTVSGDEDSPLFPTAVDVNVITPEKRIDPTEDKA